MVPRIVEESSREVMGHLQGGISPGKPSYRVFMAAREEISKNRYF
jgi:hypothetical protein